MYIQGFIPNAMLRQFRNMWKKRKHTTSAKTINSKMNGQSLLKLRTWHWYHLSQVALWDPWHQGLLSIISHSIFKPTSSQPNASSNRPRVLERTRLTWPLRALPRRASLIRGLGVSAKSPHCLHWCWPICPIIHHMAIWSLPLINHPRQWCSDCWPTAKTESRCPHSQISGQFSYFYHLARRKIYK